MREFLLWGQHRKCIGWTVLTSALCNWPWHWIVDRKHAQSCMLVAGGESNCGWRLARAFSEKTLYLFLSVNNIWLFLVSGASFKTNYHHNNPKISHICNNIPFYRPGWGFLIIHLLEKEWLLYQISYLFSPQLHIMTFVLWSHACQNCIYPTRGQ